MERLRLCLSLTSAGDPLQFSVVHFDAEHEQDAVSVYPVGPFDTDAEPLRELADQLLQLLEPRLFGWGSPPS